MMTRVTSGQQKEYVTVVRICLSGEGKEEFRGREGADLRMSDGEMRERE